MSTSVAVLSDLRVLDLTDLKGALCAKLLGDMGADVIKIEPPGGDAMRTIGPFLDGIPHRDRSLLFWFYNTSKRGITLDVRHPAGREIFQQLAAKKLVNQQCSNVALASSWVLCCPLTRRCQGP